MKKLLLLLLLVKLASAQINVVTTYPYIADIVTQVGGGNVVVRALAQGYNDPHFIVPKPSHIGKIKQADLLIINGGDLEIGWLPPLVDRASNTALVTLDLSKSIDFIEIPTDLSRDKGDIHASGNPHFHLDPHNILLAAKSVADQLKTIDPLHRSEYEKNLQDFTARWQTLTVRWEKALAPFRGRKVISYHKLFSYFYKHFGIDSIIEIEALPGITPSSQHIQKVIELGKREPVALVISDLYHSASLPQYIADALHVRMVRLPHDIGAKDGIQTLETLFETIVKELSGV